MTSAPDGAWGASQTLGDVGVGATKALTPVEVGHLALVTACAMVCVAAALHVLKRCYRRTYHNHRAGGVVVLVTGYKRSGKDTVGNHLVEQYGFERVAFADPLRDVGLAMLQSMYCMPDATPEWFTDDALKERPMVWHVDTPAAARGEPGAVFVDFDDSIGSGDAPAFIGGARLTPRELLKWFGMAMRTHAYVDIWRDLAVQRMRTALQGGRCVVVTDARFANEKSPEARAAIQEMLGDVCADVHLWRVHDDDAMPLTPTDEELARMHASEAQIHLDEPHALINNTRSATSVDDLLARVDDLVADGFRDV